MIRTYSELLAFKTFKERFSYLSIKEAIGVEKFGFERYLNQRFYHSAEWKKVRNEIITRDLGRDMGLEGYEIFGSITIHHMNPIMISDITNNTDILMNPEYLICVSDATHKAIHYGDDNFLNNLVVERTKNDTCPWRK